MADEVRRVPVQIASKVCGEFDGILAESRQASGLFWCRWLVRFRKVLVQKAVKLRMVLVQIADRVAEASVAHSRQSSGGFRRKILPRSSKLLEIPNELFFFRASLILKKN